MSAQPLESRIAHIEGVNVQIADRLNGIDRRLDSLDGRIDDLRSDMNGRFAQVDARFVQIDGRFNQIDQKFMWVIGINVTSWTTMMLALFFRH
jgi:flagellar capping protein FliD